jgi:hypothetical protein
MHYILTNITILKQFVGDIHQIPKYDNHCLSVDNIKSNVRWLIVGQDMTAFYYLPIKNLYFLLIYFPLACATLFSSAVLEVLSYHFTCEFLKFVSF